MDANAALADPTIRGFRDAVRAAYGERLARIVLFGSRARGEAQPDSDYDIAVFLRDMADRWPELDRLADIGTDILLAGGGVINALAFAAEHPPRSALMIEIDHDGVTIVP